MKAGAVVEPLLRQFLEVFDGLRGDVGQNSMTISPFEVLITATSFAAGFVSSFGASAALAENAVSASVNPATSSDFIMAQTVAIRVRGCHVPKALKLTAVPTPRTIAPQVRSTGSNHSRDRSSPKPRDAACRLSVRVFRLPSGKARTVLAAARPRVSTIQNRQSPIPNSQCPVTSLRDGNRRRTAGKPLSPRTVRRPYLQHQLGSDLVVFASHIAHGEVQAFSAGERMALVT